MKLDARRVAAFLRDPGDCRVALLYGDDAGLIRERAEALVRAVAGSLADPFRVGVLDRESLSRLPAEAASLSMAGGRFVVWARDVTDSAMGAVAAVLAGPGAAMVVLEAPGLPARSRLRTAVEAAAEGAAIGCYAEEGRALEATVRAGLAAAGVAIEGDALSFVSSQLGADRVMARQELEKLVLHAGLGGTVTLVDAASCVGDAASLSLDDALFAATAGNMAALDRALDIALSGGLSPVSALRATLGHLQRLHRAAVAVSAGAEPREAMRRLRPPVFWQREAAFGQALTIWRPPEVAAMLDQLAVAGRSCRQTGAPTETICREAFMRIARAGAASRDSGGAGLSRR